MLSTFQNCAQNYSSKRRKIGGRVGKPSVVSASNVEFAVHHTIRADLANEGITVANFAWALLQLQPELNPIQARNYTYRTLMVKSKVGIKHNPVISQKTTSNISQCTVAQQHRWNTNFTAALTFLREHNNGMCLNTCLSFGELINHYIIGLDKT